MAMNPSELDFGATIRALSAGQRVFSRFSLVRLLGRGGMGVVWLAQDDKLEREVALKFLPEAVALDPRSVDDLKQETRRSLELTHPHIVRIYDFFEDDNAAAISMEYVEGGSLARLAVEQPLRCFEPPQLIQWLRQLIDALEYAHTRARIVHRDLKPANLMVTQDGELKITDFGISATVTDSMTRVSRLMSSGATPAYSSPQQVMGERPAAADDIYSLGATIFDLVTGKPPFHSGNLLVQVQSKTPDTMRKRREEIGVKREPIPKNWERVVAACLSKEPSERPASARAVLNGLETGEVVLASDSVAKDESKPAPAPVPVIVVDDKSKAVGGDADKDRRHGPAFQRVSSAVRGHGRWLVPAVLGLAVVVLLLLWLFSGREQPDVVVSQPVPLQPGSEPGTVSSVSRQQPVQMPPLGTPVQTQTPNGTAQGPTSSEVHQQPQTSRPAANGKPADSAPVVPRGASPEQVRTQNGGRTQESVVRAPPPVVVPPPMPPTGSIEITSEPLGAIVISGGRELGQTPLAIRSHPTGTVELALRLAGYEETTVSARVKENETTRLTTRLRPVRSVPGGDHAVSVPEIGINLLWLQPGEFVLGSPESESGPESDEQPQTRVRFTKGFWIGETEVTQAQWRSLMGSNPSSNKGAGDRAPVERVSWEDAARFCQRLNERERAAGRIPAGYVYRLPTEAEWEYACRAGSAGPYAGDLAQIAVSGRRYTNTRAVASLQPNAWGLHDMHGNVAEWTNSRNGRYPGGTVDDLVPPSDGTVRIFRGGSFDSSPRSTRSAYRGWVSGDTASNNRGFRVVLAPQR